jgi:hypothetical protein
MKILKKNPLKKLILTAGLITGLAATPAQSKLHAELDLGYRTSAPTPEFSLGTGWGTKTNKNLLFQVYGGLGFNHSTKGKDVSFIAPYLGMELIPFYNRICAGLSTELKFLNQNSSYDISVFDPVKYERTTKRQTDNAHELQFTPSILFYVPVPITKQNCGVKLKIGASIPLCSERSSVPVYSVENGQDAKKKIRFAASIEGTFGNN